MNLQLVLHQHKLEACHPFYVDIHIMLNAVPISILFVDCWSQGYS